MTAPAAADPDGRHLLLVDDEASIRRAVGRFLSHHGFAVTLAADLRESRAALAQQRFACVIIDLRLPDGEGVDLLADVPDTPIVVMTAYGSVSSAVEAMKAGARDYIAKPFAHETLLLCVREILRAREARPATTGPGKDPQAALIGQSAAMQQLRDQIFQMAATEHTVLIRGASGTGKELVARSIHVSSRRAGQPLVTINCASIPDTLIEAELFGHAEGAYTGAVRPRTGLIEGADGGTLFLDEIGELSASAQARLLRVLQDGEVRRVGSNEIRRVDIRLIAATHRPLENMIEREQFRADLYYRLRVLELSMPPLAARDDDVLLLARHFLPPDVTLDATAEDALLAHAWPGNVRELANAVQRAAVVCRNQRILPEDLALQPGAAIQPAPNPTAEGPAQDDDTSLDSYFRRFVEQHQDALTETELARRLGISRKTLWERRQRFDLPRPGSSRTA